MYEQTRSDIHRGFTYLIEVSRGREQGRSIVVKEDIMI